MRRDFLLILDSEVDHAIARAWLVLAILALSVGGLFSLPPLFLRHPAIAQFIDVHALFEIALVVHVDLTILVWFLTIGSLLWYIHVALGFYRPFHLVVRTVAYLAMIGVGLMVLAAFLPSPGALKNNYIPMLQHSVFCIGLSLFGASLFLQACFTLLSTGQKLIVNDAEASLHWGIRSSAILMVGVFFSFVLTYRLMPTELKYFSGVMFYEQLFWPGGHLMQFVFTQLVMVVWVWLLTLCGRALSLSPKWLSALFSANMLAGLSMLAAFYVFEPFSMEFSEFFTLHMRYIGGIAPSILCVLTIVGAIKNCCKRSVALAPHYLKASLFLSVLLFVYGGLLGFFIHGSHVTVPAHYHGCITGISMAFIGLVYYLLPALGFGSVKGILPTIQPYCYAGGQLLHVTGLAMMGGYGALRKTAADPSMPLMHGVAKGMFFAGGSLAIFGGVLFVVIALKALIKRPKRLEF